MANIEMSFERFAATLPQILEEFLTHARGHDSGFKRGELVRRELEDFVVKAQEFAQIVSVDAPPLCQDDEAAKRITTELKGNPVYFAKVTFSKPLFGHTHARVERMDNEEQLEVFKRAA